MSGQLRDWLRVGQAFVPGPVTGEVGWHDMNIVIYASRPLSWGCRLGPLGAAWGRGLLAGVLQPCYHVRTWSSVAYFPFLSRQEQRLK